MISLTGCDLPGRRQRDGSSGSFIKRICVGGRNRAFASIFDPSGVERPISWNRFEGAGHRHAKTVCPTFRLLVGSFLLRFRGHLRIHTNRNQGFRFPFSKSEPPRRKQMILLQKSRPLGAAGMVCFLPFDFNGINMHALAPLTFHPESIANVGFQSMLKLRRLLCAVQGRV
jgi:hypothetical protein